MSRVRAVIHVVLIALIASFLAVDSSAVCADGDTVSEARCGCCDTRIATYGVPDVSDAPAYDHAERGPPASALAVPDDFAVGRWSHGTLALPDGDTVQACTTLRLPHSACRERQGGRRASRSCNYDDR
ncbi:hypothetical protein GCM10009744_57480 [Kribbella alba]|uniref:Uncharacterized protein n=1 Tax=Kribbella alba TaxID=190197 RepID=A0ABP4RLM0_9ACTN